MIVPMVQVRHVRVSMNEARMPVRVSVRSHGGTVVFVGVMLVVDMNMVMLDLDVLMDMIVARPQQEGHATEHQHTGGTVRDRRTLAEDRDRKDRSREGRSGEERSLTGGTQETERVHVEKDAQAVAEGSEYHRPSDRGNGGVETSGSSGDRQQA